MRHCAKTLAKNRQKGIEGNRQERSDGKKKFCDNPIQQDTQERRRGKDRASFSGDVIDGKNKIKSVSQHTTVSAIQKNLPADIERDKKKRIKLNQTPRRV